MLVSALSHLYPPPGLGHSWFLNNFLWLHQRCLGNGGFVLFARFREFETEFENNSGNRYDSWATLSQFIRRKTHQSQKISCYCPFNTTNFLFTDRILYGRPIAPQKQHFNIIMSLASSPEYLYIFKKLSLITTHRLQEFSFKIVKRSLLLSFRKWTYTIKASKIFLGDSVATARPGDMKVVARIYSLLLTNNYFQVQRLLCVSYSWLEAKRVLRWNSKTNAQARLDLWLSGV